MDELNDLQITVEDAILEIEDEECEYCSEDEACNDCTERYLDEQAERDIEYWQEVNAGIID